MPRRRVGGEQQQPHVGEQQQADHPEDEVVDVDAADDDPAVRASAAFVEQRGDAAGERERDGESERREHRPLPPRPEVMVQMEPLLDFLRDLVVDLLQLAHGRILAPKWAVQGSNLRPTACKAVALPAELTARAGERYRD